MSLLTAPRRARGARPTILATVLAVLATPLALGVAAPAQAAQANHLVISEAYGGGGNAGAVYKNDFIELFNPTDAPISVAGMSVQYRSNNGAGAGAVTLLTGSVPAHGYYLVQEAAGAGAQPLLPTPDATGTIAMSGTAFQVWLANSTTALTPPGGNNSATPNIIDFLGVSANAFEGATAPGVANATSSARVPDPGEDSNDNSVDFATGAPTPKNSTNRFPEPVKPPVVISEVFTHGVVDGEFGEDFVEIFNAGAADANLAEVAYSVSGGAATALTGTLAPGAYLVVPVTLDDADGSVQLTWTEDSSSIDLVGWGAGTHEGATAAPAGSATQSAQRNQDNTDTNVNGTDFSAQTPTRGAAYEPPALPLTTIAAIQGTGAGTPLAGQTVRTEGVVTASFGKTAEDWQGFYLQTGGTPATPGASDAIWVASGTLTAPAVGASVSVTGTASETFGLTTLTVVRASDIDAITALPTAIARDTLPGADCVVNGDDTTNCATGSALAALREEHESELFQPVAPFTVSDSYDGSPWANSSSNNFGEIGLAANATEPLYLPIDRAHPVDDAQLFTSLQAYNDAHMITLDDGSNRSWSGSANTALAFPWMKADYVVRVGALATFHEPFVYDFRFGKWRLQPQTAVAPGSTGEAKISFAQNRPAEPDPVGGNVKIATFNMLNYFVHAAQDWDNLPDNPPIGTNRSCTYYTDRAGNRLTANNCTWKDLRNNPPSTLPDIGPRGAATEVSLLRQEGKEVAAINTMAADVMSLEEVENPVKIGFADRDAALTRLVAALNADWAANHDDDDDALGARWALVASPRPEAQPTIAEQDAIRNAYIYNPRVVTTVGRSQILVNSPAMRNAREPLAQAFRHVDGTRDDGFIVIANHFKSKSEPDDLATVAGTDNADAGTGAGFYNGDRIRQARALDAFAKSVAEDKGIPAVFMTGDYNAYGAEDPVRVLEDADWTNLEPINGESSYSFGGLAGSLDHVFANPAALSMVTGQTIWPINANESVYYEYSRHNYNVAELFDGTDPFRSSDHNPEIIGINAPINPGPTDVDTVQVLASNDFHGRLLDDPASASAGAAAMAGAVKGLRDENDNTVFAMAGDIVGASTFESFIQNDKPTLDAMNEAGLEVSAAGNHEFDQGYDDLMDRIMTAYDATDNAEGGANWPYIAANVRLGTPTGPYALESDRTDGNFANSNGATWWKDFPTLNGGDGIRVGFVGAVTEDLDSLVAPSAIDGLAITSIVNEVNDAADALKVDGCGGVPCDVVIELVHEGAPSPSCTTIKTDTTSTFGQIVHGANDNVDAIVSGHTHLKYNCKVDVAGTIDRPVVSAGQYGANLNQLEFDFATGTDTLVGIRQHVLAMKDYDEDADTLAIVNAAVDVAAVKGQVELGQVGGPFKRARRTDTQTAGNPIVENRGGESTLGNLVAEIQRWKTGADIGVMNPGGLRDDLIGTDDLAGPVTYREAANVQPFANTLETTELTGAQVKLLLEQQWQRDPDGNIPSRPFLRLGTSKGFTFTEDSSKAEGNRITGMWLNGVAIDPAATYTVSANSFVASGGDNFRAFTLGTDTQDTGFTDLQATVDYLDEFANTSEGDSPLPVDYAQHAVGARVPAGPHAAGATVVIPVDSLSMTGAGDLVDTVVTASYNGVDLDLNRAVTNGLPTQPFDTPGTATLSFTMPVAPGGIAWIKLSGASGTVAWLPVQSVDGRADSTVTAPAVSAAYDQAGSVVATVTPSGATGTVTFAEGATTLGTVPVTAGGTATYGFIARSLSVGDHTLTLSYSGDATTRPSTSTVVVTITKSTSTVTGTAADFAWGQAGSVVATVASADATGMVQLYDGTTKLGEGTVSGGTATIALAAKSLSVGAHALTLKYLGDTNHEPDEGPVSVTVTKAATATTATATPASVVQDSGTSAIAVAVTASGFVPTGSVSAWQGATELATATLVNGQASLTVGPFATTGDKSIEVRYAGDGNATASTSTVTVTVTAKPAPQPIATTVSGTTTPITYGAAGSVTIAVAPSAATGQVELLNGTTSLGTATLAGGTAAIGVPAKALEVGTHTLVVRYLGSSTHNASQSTFPVTVAKAKPTVKVKDAKGKAGKKTKVVTHVSAIGYDVTGKVKLVARLIGSKKKVTDTVTLKDGKAVTKLVLPKAGKYKLTVVYQGDAHTLTGQARATLTAR